MVNDAQDRLQSIAGGHGWPFEFEWVPLTHLFVDERYQRPPSRQVKKIVEDFDPAMIGALTGNRRAKTKVAVIDGQHRFLALRQMGMTAAPAMVLNKLPLQQEALLFTRLQRERLNIRPLQRFRAELTAELERPVQITRVLDSLALELTESSGAGAARGSVGAVGALEALWDRGGEDYVRRVLNILVGAWDREAGSFSNEILRGVDYFLGQQEIDDDRLIDRLADESPGMLTSRASSLRAGRGMGGKSPSYMAEAIGVAYRRRRRA